MQTLESNPHQTIIMDIDHPNKTNHRLQLQAGPMYYHPQTKTKLEVTPVTFQVTTEEVISRIETKNIIKGRLKP